MSRLLLVTGMPGAGKTTRAIWLAERHDAVHLSPDAWFDALGLDPHDAPLRRRLERRLRDQARDLLRRGVPVVVDFGLWSRLERERLRRDAEALGVPAELHVLDVSLEERWARVRRRNELPGAVRITRAQLEDWEVYWQPVTPAERAAYAPALAEPPVDG